MILNQVVLVGRITTDPEVATFNNVKRTSLVVAVQRGFKNVDGEYDTDFIRIVLWNGIAENTCEYCHKGDLIGVKGRLQNSNYEKDGVTQYSTDVIAEKISEILGISVDEVGKITTKNASRVFDLD